MFIAIPVKGIRNTSIILATKMPLIIYITPIAVIIPPKTFFHLKIAIPAINSIIPNNTMKTNPKNIESLLIVRVM